MSKRLAYKDYRKTNDGVMVADLGFKKQLWALDPKLDVVWNGAKWEIWRFPRKAKKDEKRNLLDKRAVHVMTVQTEDKSFRELGADIFLKLQAGDTQRFSTKELCAYFDAMDDNIQRAKMKKIRNFSEARAKEVAWYTWGERKTVPLKVLPGTVLLEGPSKSVKIRRALQNV